MKNKFLAAILFVFVSIGAQATEIKDGSSVNDRAITLIERVHEIKDMDRSEMTRAEKKEIRVELREIKSELKEMEKTEALDDKVSISIGAIIIIILLLIII